MRAYYLKRDGEEFELTIRETATPKPGPREILIHIRAASLNKRDLFILDGSYPLRPKVDVVPLSDGVGEIVEAGSQVSRFKVGDRVAGNYFARWTNGPLSAEVFDQLGCTLDGMASEFVVLDEAWAVKIPDSLTWEEAATLPCAGVTAWNAIIGPQPLITGQTMLTLGSGGVSLFALQFAKALGARAAVITSSSEKEARLRAIGANIVVNSTRNPEWGVMIKEATAGAGADVIVETMGPDTIEQSIKAVGLHGQIALLITRGKNKPKIEISSSAYSTTLATIRRLFVGSRASFEAMNRAIEASRIKPVIDRVFSFAELKEAYRYYGQGNAFGKVVISMGE